MIQMINHEKKDKKSAVGFSGFVKLSTILCLFVGVLDGLMVLPVYGDVVYLKDGGFIEGRVTRRGDSVEVRYGGGTMVVSSKDVDRVAKKLLPTEAFAVKLIQARGDAKKCVELAHWAHRKGLNEQYVEALRTAILADHDHKTARRMLREFKLYLNQLPENSMAGEKMVADMGEGFKLHRTAHYRICYNSDAMFAEVTGRRLEEVYQAFMKFFEDRHFAPAPLTDRLEVVLFDSPLRYEKYARHVEQTMAGSSGFYSPKTRRSYFYDNFSDENQNLEANRQQIAGYQQQLKADWEKVSSKTDPQISYIVTDSAGGRRTLNRQQMLDDLRTQQRKLDAEVARLQTFYTDQNVSVTVHEATHQLAYTCGIHSKYCVTPKWLVEGLALYFEAPTKGQWDGPGQLHEKRLKNLRESWATGSFPGLHRLLVDDNTIHVSGQAGRESYAVAWGLFYYLVYDHHEKLFDYIYEMSLKINEPGESYSPGKRVSDFEKYFGKIADIEQGFKTFIGP
ncbi:MAG: DUF1570 domain-containing protein [Phycisphaerae bacterium]|nr:DUF1570 domain-containing protein [Phycisphaerae bacterium]